MSNQFKKRWTKSVAAVAVSAALWAVAPAAFASGETTGGITGSVHTTSGQTVTGAAIVIKNTSTGVTREVSTDSDGSYRFPQLPIGEYEITVTQDGKLMGRQNVSVRLGGSVNVPFNVVDAGADVIEVVGARPSAVDVGATDSGLIIGESELDALPVNQNMTAVALLAPGTVQGDGGFGNLASFSGASVAENVCYINGMNVTDPDKGLGCGSVPFEMFKEFQVKTGGYSAQFGRATGGVINAVTKSGGNEFEFDARVRYSPEGLRSSGKEVHNSGGRIFRDTRNNTLDTTDVAISASGPIIQDKLFFYAIYNPIRSDSGFSSGGTRTAGPTRFLEDDIESDFWGVKLDWEISENHRMEYFGFSDETTTERTSASYNPVTQVIGTAGVPTTFENGGVSHSVTYTGAITSDFTVKAMIGQFSIDANSIPFDVSCPSVAEGRTGLTLAQTCVFAGSPTTNEITRDIKRVDFEWAFADDHVLKFGLDSEEVEADHTTSPAGSGDAFGTWNYGRVGSGQLLEGTGYTNNTGATQDYVQRRVFAGGGLFTMDNSAIYIEDEWTVNDQLMISLGVRNDEFANAGKDGVDFVDVKDQIAPRLGVSFDPTGDGTSKIFATWGRYYFPVPVNTNYRVSSGIRDVTDTFVATSGQTITTAMVDPVTGTPIMSNVTLVDTHINSSGSVPEPRLAAVPELKPMYLEELILGYEAELSESYSYSVRGVVRETKRAIDDYCDRLSDPAGDGAVCTLFNPGQAATLGTDINYDGVLDRGTDTDGDGILDTGTDVYGTIGGMTNLDDHTADGVLDPMAVDYDGDGVLDYNAHAPTKYSASQIGMPESERHYTALQFELKHKSSDLNWTFQYVWSRSFGNNEGGVKSDNEQTDTGITTDFDFAALMDGSQGYLPNDRRHALKFYGSYELNDSWLVGWNSSLTTGRPLTATGRGYPTDPVNNPNGTPAPGYGDTYWVCYDHDNDGARGLGSIASPGRPAIPAATPCRWTQNERGSMGRTPILFNLDMGLQYRFEIAGYKANASLDILNVLDLDTATKLEERAESSSGNANPFYGQPTRWQAPRSMRLTFGVSF